MSLPFEEGVASIRSMFPQFDEETIKSVLISCNGSAENTINALLAMDQMTHTQIEIPKEYQTEEQQQFSSQPVPEPSQPVEEQQQNKQPPTSLILSPSFDENHVHSEGPSVAPQMLSSPVEPINPSSPSDNSLSRDVKVSSPISITSPLAQSQNVLPDDFLRPPSWFNQLSQQPVQPQPKRPQKMKRRLSQEEKDHMMAMSLQQQLVMEQEHEHMREQSRLRKQKRQAKQRNEQSDDNSGNGFFKGMSNTFKNFKSKFSKDNNDNVEEENSKEPKKAYTNLSMADDPELNQSLIEEEVSNKGNAEKMYDSIPTRPQQDL